MNYDKQRPLLKSQLDYIETNPIGYSVGGIPDYPNNNTHLKVYFPIEVPFEIVRNDDFCDKENTWEVRGDDPDDFDVFNNVDDAVRYALDIYRRSMQDKLDSIDKIYKDDMV